MAQANAQGDVSHDIELVDSDGIGDLSAEMKRMSDQLNATMGDVHDAACSLAYAYASAEIAAANQGLSGRTERTAADLQQAASGLGQVTVSVSVQGKAVAAERALRAVVGAHAEAVEGGEIVGRAVGTMAGIGDASRRIADTIGVIDGIAFQTDLPAPNAALVEQSAAAAESMKALAQRLTSAVRRFKLSDRRRLRALAA